MVGPRGEEEENYFLSALMDNTGYYVLVTSNTIIQYYSVFGTYIEQRICSDMYEYGAVPSTDTVL